MFTVLAVNSVVCSISSQPVVCSIYKQSLVLFAVLAANGVVFSIDGQWCYLQY